jgi:hypothetical protein
MKTKELHDDDDGGGSGCFLSICLFCLDSIMSTGSNKMNNLSRSLQLIVFNNFFPHVNYSYALEKLLVHQTLLFTISAFQVKTILLLDALQLLTMFVQTLINLQKKQFLINIFYNCTL